MRALVGVENTLGIVSVTRRMVPVFIKLFKNLCDISIHKTCNATKFYCVISFKLMIKKVLFVGLAFSFALVREHVRHGNDGHSRQHGSGSEERAENGQNLYQKINNVYLLRFELISSCD